MRASAAATPARRPVWTVRRRAPWRSDHPRPRPAAAPSPLDPHTVQLLGAHQRRQEAEQRAAGERWHETGYVFITPHGQPLDPDYLTRRFVRLVKDSGLPPVRLHDLRHGAASLAHCAGADLKTVQEQLGHSSIVLTADTYTSVLHEQLRSGRGEADHSRLKHRLRPMLGRHTDRTAQVVIGGLAFMQNLRRGHYELTAELPYLLRVAATFTELASAI
jgi:hypothetical protein